MEESKDPLVPIPTDGSFPFVPQTRPFSDYPTHLVFQMKDGSTKSIERTDKRLGKGG